MRRWLLFTQLAILLAPRLAACEASWGRTLQNRTVYSPSHRFAAILRLYENVPDFGRRRTSLILKDPIPNWHNVPVAIYDRRERINEFHVDFDLVDDLLVSDSGQYVVGILRTKNYPCADPPHLPEDQIATIYRTDGTLIGAVRLKQVTQELTARSGLLFGPRLDYSLRAERDGREILVITDDRGIIRRVLLATGVMIVGDERLARP